MMNRFAHAGVEHSNQAEQVLHEVNPVLAVVGVTIVAALLLTVVVRWIGKGEKVKSREDKS